MIIEANIDPAAVAQLSRDMQDELEFAAMGMQAAMAEQYRDIVIGNLGPSGIDRPFAWAPLSNRAPYFYAQTVGRSYATLYETGKLASSIRMDNSSAQAATVSVSEDDCSYAVMHQFGYPPKNLPARPYFPFDPQTGETTAFTLNAVKEAAEQSLAESLKAGGNW